MPPIAATSLSIFNNLLLIRTLSAKLILIEPYSVQVLSRASTSAVNSLSLATSDVTPRVIELCRYLIDDYLIENCQKLWKSTHYHNR